MIRPSPRESDSISFSSLYRALSHLLFFVSLTFTFRAGARVRAMRLVSLLLLLLLYGIPQACARARAVSAKRAFSSRAHEVFFAIRPGDFYDSTARARAIFTGRLRIAIRFAGSAEEE